MESKDEILGDSATGPVVESQSTEGDVSEPSVIGQAFGCGAIAAIAGTILAMIGFLIRGINPFDDFRAILVVAPVAFVVAFFRSLRIYRQEAATLKEANQGTSEIIIRKIRDQAEQD